MKGFDIAQQLARVVPNHTPDFSDSVDVLTLVPIGTTVTATTAAPHSLANGDTISILGAEAPATIDISSFSRSGSIATFETLQDHDFTLSKRDAANGGKTLIISGAVEPEFNGTFSIIRVINRRKLQIAVLDSGPTTISGAPLVENAGVNYFNGVFVVSNVTATTFEYTIDQPFALPASGGSIKAQTSLRVLHVLNIDQYIDQVFRPETLTDNFLVVQLGAVTQSKSRNELTDATDSAINNTAYNPSLIQTFSVYVFLRVTDQLTAEQARDKVESEYVPAIFKAVVRYPFETGFFESSYKATFVSHDQYAFGAGSELGRAVYVHEINFEQIARINEVDTNQDQFNVAMRDVSLSIRSDLGTEDSVSLDADVDLDEEPI